MDTFDVIMYGTYAIFFVIFIVIGIYAKKWDKEAEEREREKLSKMSPEERSLYLARKELAAERYRLECAKKQEEWEREKRYSKAAGDYWRADDYPEGRMRDQAKAEAMARMIANGGK